MTAISKAQAAINWTWNLPSRALSTRPLEAKASKAANLIVMNLLGRPIWTPRQYDKLAEESYQRNVVAYRAINEVSKCVGSVPFRLMKGTGKRRIEVDTHPLLTLLSRPNPLQSRSAFMQAVTGFYLIAGNSYLEMVGPRSKPPKELWIKRPDRMMVSPGPKGIPKNYTFRLAGGIVEWPVNQMTGRSEILHVKSFHPTNDWYGMSAVEAAANSIDQHNASGSWNMSLLQNSARPSGAFVVKGSDGQGELTDVEYSRVRNEIDTLMTGTATAGRPLLLEGGMEWQELSFKPTDMDWIQGKHTSARDIAMAFGMPSQMLGIPGDNTHRNMEEARLWLWEQTIIPLIQSFLEEFNWWFQPFFEEDLELMANLDNVAALIPRRQMLWDKLNKTDFLKINEKRKAIAHEEIPGGDVILVPRNKKVLGEPDKTPAASDGKDPKPEPEPEPKPRSLRAVD